MGEIIKEVRAQYDQVHADLRYEGDSFKARLSSYNSRRKAPDEPFRVFPERLETYQGASGSSQARLESDLASGLDNFYGGRMIYQ